MKQIALMIGTLLMTTVSFANSSGNQASLGARLGTTWKSHQGQPQSTRNDITIVYGGEDVSKTPTLAFRTATA